MFKVLTLQGQNVWSLQGQKVVSRYVPEQTGQIEEISSPKGSE